MEKPFQDYFPGNRCHGCGPSNFTGMQIKSFWRDEKKEETVCVWLPQKRFTAATLKTLHGGTSGSLIDCSGVWLAIADRYRREERPFGNLPIDWWYVSRNFHVELKRPVPANKGPLTVYTKLIDVFGRKTFTESRIFLGDEELVTGTTFSIAIPIKREMLESLCKPLRWLLFVRAIQSLAG